MTFLHLVQVCLERIQALLIDGIQALQIDD